MNDYDNAGNKKRTAFVCRPTPKPETNERRKNLRKGDQLVVAGSHNSFVLEVSSAEADHTPSNND